jgi:hypothetical protein
MRQNVEFRQWPPSGVAGLESLLNLTGASIQLNSTD